jgi:hypothetical protein
MPPKKRDVPSTPTRRGIAGQQTASPTKPPEKKVFTGAMAMDEDLAPHKPNREEERERRRLERELWRQRIAKQKEAGVKPKINEKNVKDASKTDTAATATATSKSSSKETQMNYDLDEETTVNSGSKPRDTSRGEFRNAKEKPSRGRARSVPPPSRSEGVNSRSSSVDSRNSKASRRKEKESNSGSDSSSSTPKRKQSEAQAASNKSKSTKTAKFDDSIPDNTGKTASTKKAAKAKKRESYADKASKEKKKEWIYQTVIEWKTRVYKCEKATTEMYSRMGNMHRVFATYDPECAIGDHMNAKAEPIRSAGEYIWTTHVPFKRHFVLEHEPEWQWDKVRGDKPRNFAGSFILLSDKPAQEILDFVRVDLREAFQGVIKIKEMQEMYTSVDLILLGVHANTNVEAVASELRKGLAIAEGDAFARKKIFEEEGTGISESLFDLLDFNWEDLDFPEIVGIRSYPKAGPYEESRSNEDTSWKLAHHFQVADACRDRVDAALVEFKSSGGLAYYFGSQALLFSISNKLKEGKEEYSKLIVKHQNVNRSVGSVTLPGAIDIDEEVTMFFEPENEGKVRAYKRVTVRDIIKKIYVKIGGRKIPVFLYCFKSPQGHYNLWFWDTVPEIRDFVDVFSKQGPAFMWHRCRLWGWQIPPLKRLFLASFTSTAATSAMNSKWCSKRNCAVQIQMSAEAAAELNFGNSPFVLKDGEDKATRQKKERGVIQRGNIRPEEIGGMDADDLQSVGDESNAETVFVSDEDEVDYEDYEDDDVSMMSDSEGFEDEGDESTVHEGTGKSDDESEDMDESMEEDDSAFSTKAGLDDLAARGRKVREDESEEEKRREKRMQELEKESREAKEKMAAQAKEMQDIMERLRFKEEALDAALRKAEEQCKDSAKSGTTGGEAQGVQDSQGADKAEEQGNDSATPGTTGEDAQGVQDSQSAAASGASADVK